MMYFHGRRGEGATFAEKFGMGIAGFCQRVSQGFVGFLSRIVGNYVWLVGVEDENERLRMENDRLLGEAVRAKQMALELEALREALGFQKRRKDLNLRPAVIVAREMSPYYKVMRLSLETEGHEVRPGMAVITHAGLLGRVVKAVGSYADVMLITDGRSRVAGEVLGKGILGMVVGTGKADDYRLRFQVSLSEPQIDDGAVVVTSGHDRLFPRGIEVGYVRNSANRRQVGAFVEYEAVPAVNPGNVLYVFVTDDGSARGH